MDQSTGKALRCIISFTCLDWLTFRRPFLRMTTSPSEAVSSPAPLCEPFCDTKQTLNCQLPLASGIVPCVPGFHTKEATSREEQETNERSWRLDRPPGLPSIFCPRATDRKRSGGSHSEEKISWWEQVNDRMRRKGSSCFVHERYSTTVRTKGLADPSLRHQLQACSIWTVCGMNLHGRS